MRSNQGSTRSIHSSVSATPPSVINPQLHQRSSEYVPPTTRELQRFLERKRYLELGHELPMNTREAAAYVGMHPKTVEKMAREGEIPAHPMSGVVRKTWKFFPSELDAWLHARVSSRRHPCSPNGEDKVQ
jgi:excisionase family DNA binding protein